MKIIACARCGSKDLYDEDGYVICSYCQSRFVPQADEKPPINTLIQLNADVEALLAKCREDPRNRIRYANLILDIDPTNQEALSYLR